MTQTPWCTGADDEAAGRRHHPRLPGTTATPSRGSCIAELHRPRSPRRAPTSRCTRRSSCAPRTRCSAPAPTSRRPRPSTWSSQARRHHRPPARDRRGAGPGRHPPRRAGAGRRASGWSRAATSSCAPTRSRSRSPRSASGLAAATISIPLRDPLSAPASAADWFLTGRSVFTRGRGTRDQGLVTHVVPAPTSWTPPSTRVLDGPARGCHRQGLTHAKRLLTTDLARALRQPRRRDGAALRAALPLRGRPAANGRRAAPLRQFLSTRRLRARAAAAPRGRRGNEPRSTVGNVCGPDPPHRTTVSG
jgi:hypothetical protein